MGFLLALDHAALMTKASPKCSKSYDLNSSNVNKNLSKRKYSKTAPPKSMTNESIQTCTKDVVGSDSNDGTIQQCLRRTLNSMNDNSVTGRKLSFVKINNATSQVVSGVKYTVAFEAKDDISGKSYSSEAVIVSQPWTEQEPAVIDFKLSRSTSI